MMKQTSLAVLLSAACLAPASAQVKIAAPEAGKSKAERDWTQVIDNDNIGRIIANARVSVVGEPDAVKTPASSPAPRAASAPSAKKARRASVAIGISGVCDNKPFAIPTWCPREGAGVVGGLYRVVEVGGADVIDFALANQPGAWTMRGVMSNTFAVVPEGTNLDAPNLGCAAGAVVCERIGLGATANVSAALAPGAYKYYDPSQPGSGYGVLIVK